jgi:hypothetical protein
VFENRVLRRIFGPKKNEGTGWWGKLHNELHDLYSSLGIIRKNGVFWDVMPCGSCKTRRFGGV